MKSQWKSHVNGKNVLETLSILSVLFDVLNNDVTAYENCRQRTIRWNLSQAAFSFDNLIYWQYLVAKYMSCAGNYSTETQLSLRGQSKNQ